MITNQSISKYLNHLIMQPLSAVALLCCTLSAWADKVDLFDPNDNRVYIMAHRATTSDTSLPDNSIEGVNAVIAAGADIIECDIWRTKDGKFIVYHDGSINGKEICSHNLSEFANARLANGEKIPTFQEYLLAGKGRICYNIDKVSTQLDKVKSGQIPDSYLRELIGVIQNCDMVNDVILFTATSEYSEQALGIEPRIAVGVWGRWSTGFLNKYPDARYYVQHTYWPERGDSQAAEGNDGYIEDWKPACINYFNSYCGGSAQIGRSTLSPEYIQNMLRLWPGLRIIQCDVSDLMNAELKKRYLNGIGYGDDIFVTPQGSGNHRGTDWQNAMSAGEFRELLYHRGEQYYNYCNGQAVRGKTFRLSAGNYNMLSYEWGVRMEFNPSEEAVSFTVEGGYDPTLSGSNLSRKNGRTVFGRGSTEPTQTASAMFWLRDKTNATFTNCDFDGGYDDYAKAADSWAPGKTHAFALGKEDGSESDVRLETEGCTVRRFNTVGLGETGSAVLLRSGSARMRDTDLHENVADNRGAVFQVINATTQPVNIMLDNCHIYNNSTRGDWGVAAHLRAGSLMMNNCMLLNNRMVSSDTSHPWAVINGSGVRLNQSVYLFVNSTIHTDGAFSYGNIRLDSEVNHLRMYNCVSTTDNADIPTVYVTEAAKGSQAISLGHNILGKTVNFSLDETDTVTPGACANVNNDGYTYAYTPSGISNWATQSELESAVKGFSPELVPSWGEEFYAWLGVESLSRDIRHLRRNPDQLQPGAYDALFASEGSLFFTPDGCGDYSGVNWHNAMNAKQLRDLIWEGDNNWNYDRLNNNVLRLGAGQYSMVDSDVWGRRLGFDSNGNHGTITIEGGYDANAGLLAFVKSEDRTVFTGHANNPSESGDAMFWLKDKITLKVTDCDFDGGFDNTLLPLASGKQHAFKLGNDQSEGDVSLELYGCDVFNFNTVGLADDGGTIAIWSGSARLRDCNIYANAADNRGAAFQIINRSNNPAYIMLDRCKVYDNCTQGLWGLAAHLRGGSIMMNNTSFVDNRQLDASVSDWALLNSSRGALDESGILIVNSTLHQANPSHCGTIRLDSPSNHLRIVNSVVSNDNASVPALNFTESSKVANALSHGYNLLTANSYFTLHDKDESHHTILMDAFIDNGVMYYHTDNLKHMTTADYIEDAVKSFSPSIAPNWGQQFYDWVGKHGFEVDVRNLDRNTTSMQPGALDEGVNGWSGVETINTSNQQTDTKPVVYYDIYGRKLNKPINGLMIVKYNDGSVRKIVGHAN